MKRVWLAFLFALLASSARADVVCVSNNMCCQSAGGVSASGNTAFTGNNTFTGTNSFIDSKFSLLDNLDATKIATFQLSGFTTGNSREFTLPGTTGNDTIATLAAGNVFTAGNQFNSSVVFQRAGNIGPIVTLGTFQSFDVGGNILLGQVTADTPDTLVLGLAEGISNSFVIGERSDIGFDYAHALQTDPTIYGHSHNQSTTQWWSLTHNATDAVMATGFGDLKLVPAGHVKMTGTAPAVSACGVTPSVVTGSDHAGKLTTGSGGTVQSCTITFAVPYSAAPACVVNDESAILLVRATSTTTTLVLDSAVAGTLASQVLSYICIQGS
jgi:hypothetical protein